MHPQYKRAPTRAIPQEVFDNLSKRGGSWAIYENHRIGNPLFGSRKYLQFGDGCTRRTAPRRLPNTVSQNNEDYEFVGTVDFRTGAPVIFKCPTPILSLKPKSFLCKLCNWQHATFFIQKLEAMSENKIRSIIAVVDRLYSKRRAAEIRKSNLISDYGSVWRDLSCAYGVISCLIQNGFVYQLKGRRFQFFLLIKSRTLPPNFLRAVRQYPDYASATYMQKKLAGKAISA